MLNLLKLADARERDTTEQTAISIASWKRRKFNERMLCEFFEGLGLSLNDEKVIDTYTQLSSYRCVKVSEVLIYRMMVNKDQPDQKRDGRINYFCYTSIVQFEC